MLTYNKPLISVLLVFVTGLGVTPLRHPYPSRSESKMHGSPISDINNREFPLSFETNVGQADQSVKYLARGNGYTLSVAPTEAVLELPIDSNPLGAMVNPIHLTFNLVGANRGVQPRGVAELTGKANYFIGNDPSKWHSDIPTFSKIQCDNVYTGIDLVYYGTRSKWEYDFIIAPGADYRTIALNFDGVDKMTLDESGSLVLNTPAGELRHRKPLAYQNSGGVRLEIPARFVLRESDVGSVHQGSAIRNQNVAFVVEEYDRSLPLVIDPVVIYSTYLGGTGDDFPGDAVVDSEGNLYVTGTTTSTNFPTKGAFQTSNNGGAFGDVFVTKFNPAGTEVIYSTYLGGSGDENPGGIDVDASGRAHITGFTRSTNFPTAKALQASFAGGSGDVFIAKLNQSGSALVYSTYLGGNGNGADSATGIAVDASGNVYVAGQAFENFPLANPLQAVSTGFDAFIAKLNSEGSALIYSTYLGGNGPDSADDIAIDSEGNAYVAGRTGSTNFPIANAVQPVFGGGPSLDCFVTKVNKTGTSFIYSTYLGGGSFDTPRTIAVDGAGNAYVGGNTASTNFPIANPLQSTLRGAADGFVSKFNATGSLVYSTYLGGTTTDQVTDIDVEADGNAYVVGNTNSIDFPTFDATQGTLAGGRDAFLVKLPSDGAVLLFSSYLGGAADDFSESVTIDNRGGVYVVGETASTDFKLLNAFQPVYGGGGFDGFITKFKDIQPPEIAAAFIEGKKLIIDGKGFENGAALLMDGERQRKTFNDEGNPASRLIARKSGKRIQPGQSVTLQVQNPDGTLSNQFGFTRPIE